jgi:hypothetical protein
MKAVRKKKVIIINLFVFMHLSITYIYIGIY